MQGTGRIMPSANTQHISTIQIIEKWIDAMKFLRVNHSQHRALFRSLFRTPQEVFINLRRRYSERVAYTRERANGEYYDERTSYFWSDQYQHALEEEFMEAETRALAYRTRLASTASFGS